MRVKQKNRNAATKSGTESERQHIRRIHRAHCIQCEMYTKFKCTFGWHAANKLISKHWMHRWIFKPKCDIPKLQMHEHTALYFMFKHLPNVSRCKVCIFDISNGQYFRSCYTYHRIQCGLSRCLTKLYLLFFLSRIRLTAIFSIQAK